MSQVFISYSSKDRNVANLVCALLEEYGHRCWIAPRDILPGKEWGEAIVSGIREARTFVLVFSQHANSSPQILREVERAVNAGIPIIPFRIEDVMPQGSLEYFMSVPHWLDALSPPVEAHVERLALAIGQLEAGEPAPIAGGLVPSRVPGGTHSRRAKVHATIVGIAFAVLLVAALFGELGPPSRTIGWIGVLLALLVPLGIAAGGLGKLWHGHAWRVGIGAAAAGLLALHLWASAAFVIEDSHGGRYVRGNICTPDAELVYESLCPNLPADALSDAEYRPELLWTSESIARMSQLIAAGWIGWVLLVSVLLGSYCAATREEK